jgi:Uma2 family endonuclease
MTDFPQERIRMTLEEFMALPETTQPTELIDGELIVSPAPKDLHQLSVGEVFLFLRTTVPGGTVRVSPSDLHIDGRNVLQPDVFWIAEDNPRCTLGEDGYWHGAPDLVIEVLSPSTLRRDRGVKFKLYEQNGVREYWLVDPESRYVEVFTLADGAFRQQGLYEAGQSFTSAVIGGKTVSVDALLG